MPGGVCGGAASGGSILTRLFVVCAVLVPHTPGNVVRLDESMAKYRVACEPMLYVSAAVCTHPGRQRQTQHMCSEWNRPQLVCQQEWDHNLSTDAEQGMSASAQKEQLTQSTCGNSTSHNTLLLKGPREPAAHEASHPHPPVKL